MNKKFYLLAGASLLFSCQQQPETANRISVDFAQKGAKVSESMYGIFFEEINHAGDGGLYAELVQNRSFEEKEIPKGYSVRDGRLYPAPVTNHITGEVRNQSFKWNPEDIPAWSLSDATKAKISLSKKNPLFAEAPTQLQVTVSDASKPVSVINSGYWGMSFQKDRHYKLRFYVNADRSYQGTVTAKLLSADNQVLASQSFDLKSHNKWEEYTAQLTASATDGKGKLAIELNQTGTLSLDYVSLFPEKTFNNHPNGLREDVAGFLQDLQPAFVRWPGGCVVEGLSLDNRFEWKKSLGDPARRPGIYDTWGYRCSYGFGYHEFLEFCEDVNAGGMYVCNVGIGCQARMGDASPDNQIPYYLDDCLDAIEYALGDVTSEWGAKRAAAGHPKPFPLQYVEIGNENGGPVYDARFDIFYKAIKEKYPQLTLISNHGLGDGVKGVKKTDMIDPHWYVNPDYFFANTTIFDNQPRGDYHVYVGEYACNSQVGAGNMLAALSEAAFITGMERNGDLVTMCSYAPLLENRNNREWPVNLIHLSTDSVVGRSSYYVQKMVAENKPNYNVSTELSLGNEVPKFGKGAFGLGTWDTQAEFKDIRLTAVTVGDNDKQIVEAGNEKWNAVKGQWTENSGVLSQLSEEKGAMNIWKIFKGEKYTLSLKARKTGGKEGFFIYFGMQDDNKTGYFLNIGGWGNTRTAVEKLENGSAVRTSKSVPHSLETNKWYDIRLVVNTSDVELFIDDIAIGKFEDKIEQRNFALAGYDESTQELILKVVNATNSPRVSTIDLKGFKEVSRDGRAITLSANAPTDENSFAEPKKIFPVEEDYHRFGTTFKYTFKPNSFTILRIKAKE
ncbi:alpha-L-arabinofuranosidase [Candidatus Symbiothrix dinenymphae]|nr:alpha-L-arabinofuranosidase [Candidatus Symbiothrix dinenymphae]